MSLFHVLLFCSFHLPEQVATYAVNKWCWKTSRFFCGWCLYGRLPETPELLARQGSLKSILEEDSASNHFYSTTKETVQRQSLEVKHDFRASSSVFRSHCSENWGMRTQLESYFLRLAFLRVPLWAKRAYIYDLQRFFLKLYLINKRKA